MATTRVGAPIFSIAKAHKAQTCLGEKIIAEDKLPNKIKLVAGIDISYGDEAAVGAAVSKFRGMSNRRVQSEVSVRSHTAFVQRDSSRSSMY
jgi:deoxyinosine 3'endonuclease (endonuclease V)